MDAIGSNVSSEGVTGVLGKPGEVGIGATSSSEGCTGVSGNPGVGEVGTNASSEFETITDSAAIE